MADAGRRVARRGATLLPVTRLGWWALGLAIGHVVGVMSWSLLGPLGAYPGLAAGMAAGVVAILAISRRGERAATVFAAALPLVLVVLFVLGELLLGHE